MKKLVIGFVFCFAFVASKAQSDQKNVLKVNPLGLLFGSASISYEHVLSEKGSFQINGNLGGFKVGSVKYSAFGGGVDYRAYLGQSTAPKGFYASPGTAFFSQKVNDGDGGTGKGTGFVLKGVIGNQWKWNSGFCLDLFGGINYYAGGKIKVDGIEYAKFSGVLPALGISIGYSF